MVSATEIVVVENQNVFFEIENKPTISKENSWLGLLYLQENSKFVTSNDETGLSCKQIFSSATPQLIDAWEIIRRNIDEFGINTTKFAIDEAVLNKVTKFIQ